MVVAGLCVRCPNAAWAAPIRARARSLNGTSGPIEAKGGGVGHGRAAGLYPAFAADGCKVAGSNPAAPTLLKSSERRAVGTAGPAIYLATPSISSGSGEQCGAARIRHSAAR